jgi:hypothetical protein
MRRHNRCPGARRITSPLCPDIVSGRNRGGGYHSSNGQCSERCSTDSVVIVKSGRS